MRKNIIYIVLMIFMGCKAIDKLEPNQTETFLKFYSESSTTVARDLLVVDDGYLVLGTFNDTTSLLLKTDLQGNKIWANSFTNFIGNSLTSVEDGYILVGDGIKPNTPTSMQLIKTDLSGNQINSAVLELPNPLYGIGVTTISSSSSDEIVAMGTLFYSSSYETIVTMGYSSNLDEVWQSYREFGVTNAVNSPYYSIYENSIGNLTMASFIANVSNSSLTVQAVSVEPDSETPIAGPILFNGETLNVTRGGLTQTPIGYAVAQTIVDSDGNNNIGVSIFDQNILDEYSFQQEDLSGNYIPTAIVNAPNGLLITGVTDQYKNQSSGTRTDTDLFLIEVGYDGHPKSNGIRNSFGGEGNETPVRLRNSSDGGYLILGNLANTKGARQIFLLKVNSKGELN